MVFSRLADIHLDNEKDSQKEFALSSLYITNGEGYVMANMGGVDFETEIRGCLAGKASGVSQVVRCEGFTSTWNWLERYGFRDQDDDLNQFCTVVRQALVDQGMAPEPIILELWSKPKSH